MLLIRSDAESLLGNLGQQGKVGVVYQARSDREPYKLVAPVRGELSGACVKASNASLGEFLATNQTKITVRALGKMGGETFDVIADGQVLASFEVPRSYKNFDLMTTEPIDGQISIQFTNDRYNPALGIDLNLTVDYIEIDGVRYETEAASTSSVGSWTPASGCDAGSKSTDTLHCADGTFTYNLN